MVAQKLMLTTTMKISMTAMAKKRAFGSGDPAMTPHGILYRYHRSRHSGSFS